MGGGASLARAHFENHDTAISSLDEDSAFTFIQTPEWMWRWCAAPPIEAWKVKHLLLFEVWESLSSPGEMVAPVYKRLAMGSSHSVHIIMQINLHTIGKARIDYSNNFKAVTSGSYIDVPPASQPSAIALTPSQLEQLAHEEPTADDDSWMPKAGPQGSHGASGWTVQSWCTAVRRARRATSRVLVVMHLSAGEPRDGDIGSVLSSLARESGLLLWESANVRTAL